MGLDTLLRRLRGMLSGVKGAPPGGLTPRERAIYNEAPRSHESVQREAPLVDPGA